LPVEVVEVLGKTPLTGRHTAHLVRLGNKLLLVSITPSGAETLAELTDPVEVDRLAGLCRAQQPQSATASFRSLMEQFGRERPSSDVARPSRMNNPEVVDRLHAAAEEDDDV
jgi:flagellar biogenesis protein FliO